MTALAGIAERAGTISVPRWLLATLIGATVFGIGALIIEGYVVGVAHDDGMYVILGKSLATGQGFRWLHIPGAPAATHFPPGYPVVLALLWWVFPEFPGNVTAFELANALFMATAAIGFFHFARLRCGFSDWGSAILAIVATLGIPTLTLTILVMSEPLFLALLLPILLAAERVAEDDQSTARDVVALALAVGAATLVRTHGIALVPAIGIVLVVRGRLKHAALFTIVAALTLVPWQLWVGAHAGAVPTTMQGNYESYGTWFANGLRAEGVDLVGRTLLRTSGNVATMLGVVTAPSLPGPVRIAAIVVVLALGAAGARALWRRARVTALFLVAYAAIVLVWPFWPVRFFWGIWPLIVLLPVLGVRDALVWRPSNSTSRGARIAAIAAGMLVACGYMAYNIIGYRREYWASIPRHVSDEVRPMLVWVASHAPSNMVLAAEAETSVYLYTGHPTVPVTTFTVDEFFAPRTPAENAAVVDTVLRSYHPRAVLVSSGNMREAARELASTQPPKLVVVDTFPGGGLVLLPRSR